MRKHFGILALVMILSLAFLLPVEAIKIAPYSQPLHDIMHWDAKSATLVIMNPENERLTVAWPATVDLWNYDGKEWMFDLPDGDNFGFNKVVHVDLTYAGSAVAGSFPSMILSTTLTGDSTGSAYTEVLNVTLYSQYQTGNWANAIMARIIYDPGGDARGGMAAVIASEMYLKDGATTGGSYYNFESTMVAPTSWAGALPTSQVVAFEHYVTAGAGKADLDDNAVLFHLEGVTEAVNDLFYLADLTVTKADGLLKINIAGTVYYMFITTAVNGGD